MKYVFVVFFVFTLSKIYAQAPQKINWETLSAVKFDKKWNKQEATFVLIPNFDPKITALQSKVIEISGYMIPVDVDASYYVLSANPYSSCFFCGQAGPESVMSVKFKKLSKRLNTDDRVTLRGKLTLNKDDINELNYILTEAILMQ